MSLAALSIKRPIFITSIVILMIVVGLISLRRLGVDLFPDVEIPIIGITTFYEGASPEEVENLVTRPIEDEVSSLSGLQNIVSTSRDGVSVITLKFTVDTDFQYAEQQVRDKLMKVRPSLPEDASEYTITRYDPASMPVMRIALEAELPPTKLYDLAKEEIKMKLGQAKFVGAVTIVGGTRREIKVELDQNLLNTFYVPAIAVASQLKSAGANVPVGKFEAGEKETLYRTVGEFTSLKQIEDTVVSHSGDVANAVTVKSIGRVVDGAEDPLTTAWFYQVRGKDGRNKNEKTMYPAIFLDVYKQSGANTVAMVDSVMKSIGHINDSMKNRPGSPRLVRIFDTARWIRSNIREVNFTIIVGIILAVFVVYLFLGNVRSTFITGIAIPNSLIGAFILMYAFGFSINLLTLMALSLTVGLLIDDAIVVRENIFRKLEKGMHPFRAAEAGTNEVLLAVIASTLTIVAVFVPVGLLTGMVGQYFREFGFTIVFAMMISLFDALTVAPLLSGYFAGRGGKADNVVVQYFDRFQARLEEWYGKGMRYSINHPFVIILITTVIFVTSLGAFVVVKKTFMQEGDDGEFMVNIEMPTESSLAGTEAVAKRIAERLSDLPEINYMTVTAGTDQGESNKGAIGVFMVKAKERRRNTVQLKEVVRERLKEFAFARPSVGYLEVGQGEGPPFVLNLLGSDLKQIEEYSKKVVEALKGIRDLTEIQSTLREGKPEFRIQMDTHAMQTLGVTARTAGQELRLHLAGDVVGKLHEAGIEYDVRMRLRPEQRNLRRYFGEIKIPNMQQKLIPLSSIAKGHDEYSPSEIRRRDRIRTVQITANLTPGGGIGDAMEGARQILDRKMPPPPGISYQFVGQAEDFTELVENMLLAFVLSIVFIYLVLASLYESFITPVIILMALPPALSGAFFALFAAGEMFDLFSMIGVIMLTGLVTKNSILLVDFAVERVRAGIDRKEAIHQAGMLRLRPILMTTFATLAGALPLALGIGEAAAFRKSMGIAIIGGVALSTLITLFVVPAIFEFVDIFRERVESRFRPAGVAPDGTLIAEALPPIEETDADNAKKLLRRNRKGGKKP